jgi:hypothetical protein
MTFHSSAAVPFAMKCLHCPPHRQGGFRNSDPHGESRPDLFLTILAMADCRERRFHLSPIADLPAKAAADHSLILTSCLAQNSRRVAGTALLRRVA